VGPAAAPLRSPRTGDLTSGGFIPNRLRRKSVPHARRFIFPSVSLLPRSPC